MQVEPGALHVGVQSDREWVTHSLTSWKQMTSGSSIAISFEIDSGSCRAQQQEVRRHAQQLRKHNQGATAGEL